MIFPFLIIFFPIVGILIKLNSDGPVVFIDKRYGKSGKIFTCYKFRTMYVDNENTLRQYLDSNSVDRDHWESYRKLPNDPRITRIGKPLRKTGFDELPQFINIIKGDMSLIGPRPFMIREWSDLEPHANIVLSHRPGLIGAWLANGRNELTFDQRINVELDYIRKWSLKLDLLTFRRCVISIVTGRGAE